MNINRGTYSFWWEEECKETYLYEADEEYEEPIILKQAIIPAREIDLSDWQTVDFPWHGFSEADFIRLNAELQDVLPNIKTLLHSKEVTELKNKNQEVYNAYFQDPLCVVFKDESGRYGFNGDGRHRIYVAQKCDGMLPVWVVGYAKIKSLSMIEYLQRALCGEWRFYGFNPPPLQIPVHDGNNKYADLDSID